MAMHYYLTEALQNISFHVTKNYIERWEKVSQHYNTNLTENISESLPMEKSVGEVSHLI